ncbi:hypothetical protein H312_01400 [Anncaliia algerae PRA339]|uniref:Uncharacterized protein n=1 Tax=Anncaliia algerae PRA339 TaxID=1288291 RepID=A0A059F1Y2_9MICR|nr:hypothetical protein H312_01400 [Anncaliia algerae PRA339]
MIFRFCRTAKFIQHEICSNYYKADFIESLQKKVIKKLFKKNLQYKRIYLDSINYMISKFIIDDLNNIECYCPDFMNAYGVIRKSVAYSEKLGKNVSWAAIEH